MEFKLTSQFKPMGDQPAAITQLCEGIVNGDKAQTLLGVTGSGKTFTMANVIQKVEKPTLIITHNKTLVAQLYGEFKQFFPDNAVEYFVSYYDYYQPEAYMPVTNTFIEKDLSINDEVEKLRLSTTSSLLSGRRDVVVVASVSCIYGLGNPHEFKNNIIRLSVGDAVSMNTFLLDLVTALYSRTENDFQRGNFRVRGDIIDVYPAYADIAYRIVFFGDEIEEMSTIDPVSGKKMEDIHDMAIFPANMYVSSKEYQHQIIKEIQDELHAQVEYFSEIGRNQEAARLKERVEFDIEMIKELGYCSGIENYSRFLDRRNPGDRPFCLLDYFPDDFLLVVDESHVTMPQISAMYGGDKARKKNLVEYGFRLPSAMDNRPLTFGEFETIWGQAVFVSATPADYELDQSEGVVVEQVVRPTGLLDPPIDVRPSLDQIDDLIGEIDNRIKLGDRVLVTTLTKRMAEELSRYFANLNINCRYIHSEVDTLERVEILRDLRLGKFDVLIGVNLLREGLDLPEVSLVAILDADKEGFLRSTRSLTQIAGRAARNARGLVIMYADRMTDSMKRTIEETERRREKQMKYNEEHGITPTTVKKSTHEIFKQASVLDIKGQDENQYYVEQEEVSLAADPAFEYMTKADLEKSVERVKKQMQKAARQQDYLAAAKYRDEMFVLQKTIDEKFS